MRQLVLLFTFLSVLAGCSGSTEHRNNARDHEPLYPEFSCQEIEGEVRTSSDAIISFENVGFSLDHGWIRDVEYFIKPECVLTSDQYKPDLIGGRTVEFKLRYRSRDEEAHILVFKIADYKNAFAHYPQYVENRDAELRSLIADPTNVKRFGRDAPPHVTWMDASETFYAKGARVDFVNGRGLLTVTQISQDAFITISNSRLQFLFQGFTTDGQYFVEMNFPTKLKGLPDEENEFRSSVGWGRESYNSPEHLAAYENYILKTAARIDQASATDFRPTLSQIEAFIRGLDIKTDSDDAR